MTHPIDILSKGFGALATMIETHWWAAILFLLAPLTLPILMRCWLAVLWTACLLATSTLMMTAQIMYSWLPWLAAWPVSVLLILLHRHNQKVTRRHLELLQAIRETRAS